MLKFNGDPYKDAYFICMLGPQFGLRSNVKQTGITPQVLKFPANKEAYKGMDLGATFGIGTRINFSDMLNMGILFRVDGSLGDIEDKDNYWVDNVHQNRATSYNVTGGFLFNLNYVISQ